MAGGLYGPNLSAQVPDPCTYDKASDICKACEDACNAAYSVFSAAGNASNQGLLTAATMAMVASASGAQQMAELKSELDDCYAMAMAADAMNNEHLAADPNGDQGTLDAADLGQLQDTVQVCSSMMNTIDEFFNVDILGDLSDAVVNVADKVSSTIANAAAKVVGNTLGALWWVVAGGVVLLLFLVQEKKELF
jgi:hypothetical protein